MEFYNIINGIASTPFCINKALLNYIKENNNRFKLLLYDPYIGLSDTDVKSIRQDKVKYAEFTSAVSKYNLERHIISIATLYENQKNIYFPMKMDSRGRIYCIPMYLQYQGTELAKSLLLFANKTKLKLSDSRSMEYLYCYGANCYGNTIDKLSMSSKIQ